jgi:hypothetical protein
MAQKVKTGETQRDSTLKRGSLGRDGAFKPLRLPAVAAAVQASAKQPPRQTIQRDIPAILREDALDD